ncbi:MAG: hypothetical protein WDN31_18965 [Hyphomicrobium sp.]
MSIADRRREDRDDVLGAACGNDAARAVSPFVGFRPTILLNPAGTLPEPAVSVPSENETSPPATATAEPELDPPETCASLNTLDGMP